ncbi:uncharacterized protein [Ambystoma mexicanum]|uniref:uncharacterized protein n=1 Tax=Ambystoma mexicanum TaxID=8296 RepID=UPI0037E7256C
MSNPERLAVKNLASHPDIILRKADKGGAVVMLNRSDYINECLRQLNDKSFYQPITEDPTKRLAALISNKVEKALERGWICQQECDYLQVKDPTIPKFYILPKIHKTMVNPPGRPIVSGTGAILEPLSRFADRYLKPYVAAMYSFVQDTTEVINMVEDMQFDPQQQLMVSLDIVSLYTCIPQQDTLQVLEETLLNKRTTGKVPNSFILWCAEMALTENYFGFNGQLYHQVHGTAMGSSVAPSAANLYVESFERGVIYNPSNPFFENLGLWRRYIDILIIWNGTVARFEKFVEWINKQNRYMKFTSTHSNKELNFLDVTVWVDSGSNILKVKPFHKPTDRNSLLDFSSCHPRHTRENLPFGQFLRLKRNSSTRDIFRQEAQVLGSKLKARHYPEKIIKRTYKRSSNNDRSALLEYRDRTTESKNLVFVSTFSPLANQVVKIITKNWHILRGGECPLDPPMCAFKRGSNLKELLTKNISRGQHQQKSITEMWGLPKMVGHAPCGQCTNCILTSRTLQVDIGLKKLWLQKTFTNCNSSNVVYAIWCPCGKMYIGMTKRKVKVRISEHRSCIKNKVMTAPMVGHFVVMNHKADELRWTVLLHIAAGIDGDSVTKRLLTKETWLIFLCNTTEIGLNEAIDWNNI